MASTANSTAVPSRRQFFGSAAGAGLAAAGPPIFTVAGTSTMAAACISAIAHREWIDTVAAQVQWDDDRLNLECEVVNSAITNATSTPSQGIGDITAKARLGLDHMVQNGDDQTFGLALVAVILREIIALSN